MGLSKGEFDQAMKRMDDNFAALHEAIKALPCPAHSDQLGGAFRRIESLEGTRSYAQGVLMACGKITAALGGLGGVYAVAKKLLEHRGHP